MKHLILFFAVILAACSPSSTNTYETTNKAQWGTATIEIHWMHTQADVDNFCTSLKDMGGGNHYGACARSKPSDIKICEIYMVQPDNFDDTKNLATLGHEAWHCFGAIHK